MVSGRKIGDINHKTSSGMVNMQKLFNDKIRWVNGFSSDEVISIQYRIPLKKVLKMTQSQRDTKWHEICYIKKYLRNTLHFSIDYLTISKGTELYNEEFGRRILKRNTNIYYRIGKIEDAHIISKRYKKLANAFYKSGDNVVTSAEEYEKEIPIQEVLELKN